MNPSAALTVQAAVPPGTPPGQLVPTHRRDIQALRAFAVAAVVLFHVAPGVFRGGFIGVDVFFVVSGYLVGGHLYREALAGGIKFRQFFAKRARRIVPVSALVATFTIVCVAPAASRLDLVLWGPHPTIPTYTRDGIASVLGVSNLWFGISDQGYLLDGYQSPYTQYWSLGVEEQFYVLAPALLALVLWRSRNRRLAILIVVAATVVSFDMAVYGATTAGVGPFFNPLTRAWELGVGLVVAMAAHRLVHRRALIRGGRALVVVAWCALGAMAFWLGGTGAWPSAVTAAPVGATALIIAAGLALPAGKLANWRPFQWLGDRSYSVYLWHWPFVALILGSTALGRPVLSGAVIGLTLLSAWASYRWVEGPLRRLPVATREAANKTLAICGLFIVGAVGVILAVGAHASTGPASTQFHAPAYRPVPAETQGQDFATVVPLNVRPSLVRASEDIPLADKDGCAVSPVASGASPTTCIYGESGPLVVLYGDSHALQWLGALTPGVDNGQYRVAIVTANSCPPYASAAPQFGPGCASWQAAAVSYLKTLSPELVVISASTWRERDHGSSELVQVKDSLHNLGNDLAGLRVAWIADTPIHAFVPADCAVADVRYISSCTTSRTFGLDSPLTETFHAASDANGWEWIDMNDYLCGPSTCGIILGDVFIYRDDDHMTNTFSTELAPVVDKRVLALLGK